MEKLDRNLLLCFGITTLLGIGLHFLFDLWPSILTEFFAPVNESLWEHIKLLFWPYLSAGFYLTQTGRWRTAPWLLTLLTICALLLVGGWYLHITLEVHALALDITLYLLLMGMGFFLPVVLPVGERWEQPLIWLVILLLGLIVCWTIRPPDASLFYDLSLADTFLKLPC